MLGLSWYNLKELQKANDNLLKASELGDKEAQQMLLQNNPE